jgi:hypothetical protein
VEIATNGDLGRRVATTHLLHKHCALQRSHLRHLRGAVIVHERS